MKRGLRSFLSVALTLSVLLSLCVPAWADGDEDVIGGTGASDSPFQVGKTTGITAYKMKTDGQYALRYSNATGPSKSYITAENQTGSVGATVKYLQATGLVVGAGEFVVLTVDLPTEIRGDGDLTYSSNGSAVITGVDSSGVGVPKGSLHVAPGMVARVTGAFGTVSGKVQPAGDVTKNVTLGGSSYTVNGVDTNGNETGGTYNVTINGNALVSGIFSSLTINDGATVTITADTYISGSITNNGTLTVRQGVTLCVNGTSVKPAADVTIQTWSSQPTLPAGNYTAAAGSWKLGGDVTVNTTECGYSEHNVETAGGKHENTLNATLNGHTLTVTDGTVKALGAGTVVGGDDGKAALQVASSDVKAHGAFKSITMEPFDDDGNPTTANVPAAFTVPAGQTISAEYTYLENNSDVTVRNSVTVEQDTVFTAFDGELPVSSDESKPYRFSSVSGKWSNSDTPTGGTDTYVGNNATLTVNKDGMVISGTFTKLNTNNHSVTLGGDTRIEGGAFTVAGSGSSGPYNLTIAGGTGTVTGQFKKLIVTGGTVVDAESPKLQIDITKSGAKDTAIELSGGELTLSHSPSIKVNGDSSKPAVKVTGGTLTMLNGAVEAWGDQINAIYVSDGGETILGDTAAYHNAPNIIVHGDKSACLYLNNGGSSTVYRGDLSFDGKDSLGIYVNHSGFVRLYPNDEYGMENPTKDAPCQIHIHGGTNAMAAMWVHDSGRFEIRGRGARLDQPYRDDLRGYALYISDKAIVKDGETKLYPLAGGTFNGKVYYQFDGTTQLSIAELIPVNHYLRFDEDTPNYGASDGSRGILPLPKKGDYTDGYRYGNYVTKYGKANDFNETYLDCFGKRGEYYSIVDAEWELRYQMTVENGSYQIPAGLLDGSGAVTNTLVLDQKDPDKWAIGKMQGDLNVSGTGAKLYLAGRTLTYGGASTVTQYLTDVVSGTSDTFKDKLHTVAVITGGGLTVIDAVSGGTGKDQTADQKFTGGYIGTGTIAYTGTANDETAAVHVCTGGTLNVVSGKLVNGNANNESSGVYLHGGTASFGTATGSAEFENNDNAIIQVSGVKQALKVTAGEATVYGGTLKATGSKEVYGAVLTGGALIVKGGVLSGNNGNLAMSCGVYAIGGTATITGGCLYGIYQNDSSNSGTSLCVNDATAKVNVQIDEAHKGYTTEATAETEGRHHICNINVKRGTLKVGTRGAKTDNYLRNNGTLTLEGGTTYYFDGVTMGNTVVYGANDPNNFGTEFFVEDGDFGSLKVENYNSSTMTYAVNLNKYVQLHGGYFESITNNAAASAPVSSVQNLIGVWQERNHDGTGGADWARYNHYAATVSSQRSERGEWSAVTAIQSGTAKTDALEQIQSESGKAVSIRSAVDEFKAWAKGGTPSTFKLYANLWLDDAALCSATYCDAAYAPVTVNVANRTLDLNGFGIFGETTDALLTVDGGSLTVRKGSADASEAYADRIRNFGSGAALNTAANGTLTVDGAQINSIGNALTTSGTTTVKSGTIMGTLGINATDGNLTVTGGTIGGADGIIFDGNGNLSISGGAIKSLDVKAGTGAISLTGDATYESVETARDSVYSSLLGNGYDWQMTVGNSNPASMPRTKTNYGTGSSLVKSLSPATDTVYSVTPVTHRLTVSENSANMTTDGATKALTVTCYVDDAELPNASVSAATSDAGVATVAGTYTVTKKGADTNTATITFTSAYGDKVTFRVNPAPVQGGGGTPAPTTTVSVSGDENSVSISASVSGGTATMSEPTDKELEKVIGAGVETGEVVINMSGLNDSVTTAAIPSNTVKAVEKAVSDTTNDASGLTIKLPNATATFDAAAVSAIANQAKESSLALNVEEVAVSKLASAQQSALKGLDVQEVISVTLKSGTAAISDFGGGSATVSVSYTLKSGQNARGIVVWYVANDGTLTEIPAAYANGTVTFTTTHFSDYVIAYDAARAAACPQDSTCPIAAFADADATAWYHDGVHWALENGVMSGMGDGAFAPDGTTTRAMVAQILWNLEGKPAYVGMSEYGDVDNEAWYGPAIRWASAEGIVTGYENPTGTGMLFDPDGAVTREQLAAMLYRYAQYKKADVSASANLSSFGDAGAVSDWATAAMQWAVGAGIVNGADGKLLPQGNASRAQVATMLMRYSTAK